MSTPIAPTDSAPVKGTFVDVVAHNVSVDSVKSDVIHTICGDCSSLNEVAMPKEFYHVVAYGSGIGVFAHQAVADALVLGVPRASRVVYHSKAEAFDALEAALRTKAADVVLPKGQAGN
ncbi:hypothetical protein CC1G_09557 [Coprinopsis cinerea okayama7|uniref:Uncharacterized protein n=1 Tax=Coprinopsis cinerea (strain Okayama-7 / 130 / ATCC MYA-4618 / FGSC 9003) TaxID=240176 RepID=A8P957_COPC7|nr:hypothetical protein CC1G_09557 [Coprinopsis cinerea okayama7\|eukprot:XP_001839702.1 hypothetical protein CC1G_09557 [Coprinopsis cinerea okayama7\